MRYLAIDNGRKRMGLAICDRDEMIVSPLCQLDVIPGRVDQLIDQLKQIVEENEIDEVVLGLPIHMDDSESEQSMRARAFGKALTQRIGIELHLQDERLSSVAADEMLAESGLTNKKRKARRDMLAACDILRSFLEHKHQMSMTDQESRDEQGI